MRFHKFKLMVSPRNMLFCGGPSFRIGSLLFKRCASTVNKWFDKGHVYYVHTARTGIRQVCELMGLGTGAEVLAPAYNCGSEIDVLCKSGASVVLYDVDRLCMADIDDLRKRITVKTKAVYVIHYFGFPQRLSEIETICDQYGLYLIEDCALSLFGCDGDVRLGTIGDAAVFNFPKMLPVPGGGTLVINNPDLCAGNWILEQPGFLGTFRNMLPLIKRYILRFIEGGTLFKWIWRLFKKRAPYLYGAQKDHFEGRPEMPWHYYYNGQLTNRAMSGVTRRILNSCDIGNIINRRRDNFACYLKLLSDISQVQPMFNGLPQGVCPLCFPVVVSNRGQVCRRLKDRSIAAFEWWAGYHRGFLWDQYPNACFLKDHVLTLPVHQQLSERHIEYIVHELREALANV